MILVAILATAGVLPAASIGASGSHSNGLIRNGLIVFSRDAQEGQETSNLYAINSRGGAARLLIGGNAVDFSPSWSPDGSKLAFDRFRGPPSNLVEKIVVANADGSNVREIADGGNPVWSPRGGEIAYESRSRIFVIHPDGSGKRRLSSLRLDASSPAWSPDGRRLAFVGTRASGALDIWFVYLVSKNGRGEHRLAPVQQVASPPAWSPGGKLLAFAGGNDRYTKLLLASAYGRLKIRTLLTRPAASLGSIGSIGWSGNGKTIAFDGTDSPDTHAPYSVYLVRSSGRGMKRVRHSAWDPSWSPDGRKLVFTTFYRDFHAFEIVNSQGRLVRWIDISTANDYGPAWQPLP